MATAPQNRTRTTWVVVLVLAAVVLAAVVAIAVQRGGAEVGGSIEGNSSTPIGTINE